MTHDHHSLFGYFPSNIPALLLGGQKILLLACVFIYSYRVCVESFCVTKHTHTHTPPARLICRTLLWQWKERHKTVNWLLPKSNSSLTFTLTKTNSHTHTECLHVHVISLRKKSVSNSCCLIVGLFPELDLGRGIKPARIRALMWMTCVAEVNVWKH